MYGGRGLDNRYYYFILFFTANGFLPGGSRTTIRHITQNNTTTKRNTAYKNYTDNKGHATHAIMNRMQPT
jgi:hypothetical protein